MIRFGSRVDVYLPAGAVPLVSEGQTSLAGETVIAEIGATPQSRSFRVDYGIFGRSGYGIVE